MATAANSRTVWVHGHAGSLQTSTGFLVERLGYFLRLKGEGNDDVWVHYAVPTVEDADSWWVDRMRMQIRTWGEGAITRVDVWDGASRLSTVERVLSSSVGAQRRETDSTEGLCTIDLDLPRAPEPVPSIVAAGIGVSLLVRSTKPRDAVAIAAVGVDFKGS